MRNLSDMNDLYNAQDVILLCEIFENRFQMMHEKFGFNPRKCNSATNLSSCVHRNQSKVIIAFLTSNNHEEIFEKRFSGGFSHVNTSLTFDMKILMPNILPDNRSSIHLNQNEDFKSYKNR